MSNYLTKSFPSWLFPELVSWIKTVLEIYLRNSCHMMSRDVTCLIFFEHRSLTIWKQSRINVVLLVKTFPQHFTLILPTFQIPVSFLWSFVSILTLETKSKTWDHNPADCLETKSREIHSRYWSIGLFWIGFLEIALDNCSKYLGWS